MIEQIVESDLDFLKRLDRKLHYQTEVKDGFYRGTFIDHYTDAKLEEGETQRVMDLINKRDFAIIPINTAMGFKVGFAVLYMSNGLIGMPLEEEWVLKFVSEQLPKEYTWGRMARKFTRKRNKELLKMVGLEEPKTDRHFYEY